MPGGAQNDTERSRRQCNLESFEGNKVFEDAACALRQGFVMGLSITRASSGRIFHFRISQPRMDRARIQEMTARPEFPHYLLQEKQQCRQSIVTESASITRSTAPAHRCC
jgi:hypothetical protein